MNKESANTPITLEEKQGLLIDHVTTKEELDRFEHENILEAYDWAMHRKHADLLTQNFIRTLHKKMFCHVWKWAGEYRNTEKNIGVPPFQIGIELKKFLDDVIFWVDKKTFPKDEMAARVHHRLVWIHPFPNGNGRHARLFTDLFLTQILSEPKFTWGSNQITRKPSVVRTQYIQALQSADQKDFKPLLKFIRT